MGLKWKKMTGGHKFIWKLTYVIRLKMTPENLINSTAKLCLIRKSLFLFLLSLQVV